MRGDLLDREFLSFHFTFQICAAGSAIFPFPSSLHRPFFFKLHNLSQSVLIWLSYFTVKHTHCGIESTCIWYHMMLWDSVMQRLVMYVHIVSFRLNCFCFLSFCVFEIFGTPPTFPDCVYFTELMNQSTLNRFCCVFTTLQITRSIIYTMI